MHLMVLGLLIHFKLRGRGGRKEERKEKRKEGRKKGGKEERKEGRQERRKDEERSLGNHERMHDKVDAFDSRKIKK